jgi:hypothetical protein
VAIIFHTSGTISDNLIGFFAIAQAAAASLAGTTEKKEKSQNGDNEENQKVSHCLKRFVCEENGF